MLARIPSTVDDDALSRSSDERAVTPLNTIAASSSDWVSCDWEEIENAYDSSSDDNNTDDDDDNSVRGCTADDSMEYLSAILDDEETDGHIDFAGDGTTLRLSGYGHQVVRRGSIRELVLLDDRCTYDDFGMPEPASE